MLDLITSMKAILNTDHHADRNHVMVEHSNVVVEDALAPFGMHLTRVVTHIADGITVLRRHPMTLTTRWKPG